MDKLKVGDLDDLTLALIIEDHFGSKNLRKHPSGVWFFDGNIWRLMKDQVLKAIATDLLAQKIDQVRDARVKAAISLFKSRHFDEHELFELGDPNIIVLKDGYYHLDGDNWLKRPPDRDLMRRIQLPASYVDDQPSAFNKFLNEILFGADGNTDPMQVSSASLFGKCLDIVS